MLQADTLRRCRLRGSPYPRKPWSADSYPPRKIWTRCRNSSSIDSPGTSVRLMYMLYPPASLPRSGFVPFVGQIILQALEQEGSKPPFVRIQTNEKLAFEQVGKETLHQIGGCVVIQSASLQIHEERLSVSLAEPGQSRGRTTLSISNVAPQMCLADRLTRLDSSGNVYFV